MKTQGGPKGGEVLSKLPSEPSCCPQEASDPSSAWALTPDSPLLACEGGPALLSTRSGLRHIDLSLKVEPSVLPVFGLQPICVDLQRDQPCPLSCWFVLL